MPELLDRLNASLEGRYAVEGEVGRGGMATVFRARDLKHGRPVAIKVLHPDLAASVGAERFLREIEILAGLNHPNILSLHDSGEADGLLYYVMPFVQGESLRDRLRREGQLPIEDAVQVTREVADALGFAHGKGFVHRDVKPGNIMFVAGHAVVTDFGIARAVSEAGGDQLTRTGLSVGTPHYMSPEQATGAQEIDPRSDVYSLGCVLYEMVGGEPPYTGPTSQAILARHSQAEIPSVEIIRPQTPPHVTRVIEKALSKAPADRFRTAGHMRDALTGEAELPASKRRTAEPNRWGRVALIVASVVVLAAVAWGASRVWSGGGEAPVAEAGSMVIIPFLERGTGLDSTALSGSKIAQLLYGKLREGRYTVVTPAVTRQLVEELCEAGSRENQCASKVAAELGTDRYVYGSVTPLGGDSVEITVNPNDLTAEIPPTSFTVAGSLDDQIALLDSLAMGLWYKFASEGEHAVRLASLSTNSPAALAAFLDGEYLFQGLHDSNLRGDARDYMRRAVSIDSTFALAWYRLATISHWAGGTIEALDAAERARRYSHKLSETDQRMLEALIPHMQGQVDEAEAIYKEILEEDPDNAEALYALGQLYWAYNWRQGRSVVESVEPLRRVVELAPSQSTAAAYLQYALGAAGELDAMDSLLVRYENPAHRLGIQLIRAIDSGDSAAIQTAVKACRESWEYAGYAVSMLKYYWQTRDPDLAMLVEIDLPKTDSAYLANVTDPASDITRGRHETQLWLASLEFGRGRLASGRTYTRAADSIPYSPALAEWGILVTMPFMQPDPEDANWLRSRIGSDVRPDSVPRESWLIGLRHWLIQRQANLYLLGLLAASDGDYDSARAFARTLEGVESPERTPTVSRDLARGLRADVLYREGRLEEALAELDAAEWHVSYMDAWRSSFVAGLREPMLRALILKDLGKYDEALRYFTYSGDIFVSAWTHLKRGEIYEELGDIDQAIWHYETFAEIWKDADPAFQEKRTEVLRHVSELKSEPFETQQAAGGA